LSRASIARGIAAHFLVLVERHLAVRLDLPRPRLVHVMQQKRQPQQRQPAGQAGLTLGKRALQYGAVWPEFSRVLLAQAIERGQRLQRMRPDIEMMIGVLLAAHHGLELRRQLPQHAVSGQPLHVLADRPRH
jgi:hypothetical protein